MAHPRSRRGWSTMSRRFLRQLHAGDQAELGVHVGEVGLQGAGQHEEPCRDVLVAQPFGDESGDVAFGRVSDAQPLAATFADHVRVGRTQSLRRRSALRLRPTGTRSRPRRRWRAAWRRQLRGRIGRARIGRHRSVASRRRRPVQPDRLVGTTGLAGQIGQRIEDARHEHESRGCGPLHEGMMRVVVGAFGLAERDGDTSPGRQGPRPRGAPCRSSTRHRCRPTLGRWPDRRRPFAGPNADHRGGAGLRPRGVRRPPGRWCRRLEGRAGWLPACCPCRQCARSDGVGACRGLRRWSRTPQTPAARSARVAPPRRRGRGRSVRQ
jgi:hypothetical protein